MQAAPITRVDKDFAKRALEKYKNKRKRTEKGCHIPDKEPRDDGYVRWSITRGSTKQAFGAEEGEKTFYLHHLAWYATDHRMPQPVVEHLSHLCGDGRCFNPEHLHVEDPKSNNARKNCLVAVKCPCPCGHAFWVCTHEPRCIPPADLAAALAKADAPSED